MRFMCRQDAGGASQLSSTAIYLHLTRKHLEQLHSPFDLLRLPRLEELDKPQA